MLKLSENLNTYSSFIISRVVACFSLIDSLNDIIYFLVTWYQLQKKKIAVKNYNKLARKYNLLPNLETHSVEVTSAVIGLFQVFLFLSAILLLLGIYKNKRMLMLPWIILRGCAIVLFSLCDVYHCFIISDVIIYPDRILYQIIWGIIWWLVYYHFCAIKQDG
ncbi:uncharacterized protein LOC142331466 isoform X2 [Lycorma delicatula]|uniref:uncharacterized protein LOC142331466 isoform X2 n=1 Tax=Lycorma delicatula TaxID=130591 RepID=UPI003F50EF40